MNKIQPEDLENLKFDGIIVGVPIMEKIKEGQHNDISFIIECSYYTNGKHGYPEPGSGCDNSSFYHVAYNMNCLPNGLWMNATSRFTIEHSFRFDSYDYYKFDNMEEFCFWYLKRCDNRNEDDILFTRISKLPLQEDEKIQLYKKLKAREQHLEGVLNDFKMEKISPDVKPNEPLMWDGTQYVNKPKETRREKLKDVSQLFLYQTELNDLEDKLDNTEGYWEQQELKEQLSNLKTEFETWMNEVV